MMCLSSKATRRASPAPRRSAPLRQIAPSRETQKPRAAHPGLKTVPQRNGASVSAPIAGPITRRPQAFSSTAAVRSRSAATSAVTCRAASWRSAHRTPKAADYRLDRDRCSSGDPSVPSARSPSLLQFVRRENAIMIRELSCAGDLAGAPRSSRTAADSGHWLADGASARADGSERVLPGLVHRQLAPGLV
jgi:hypothetical protein